MYVLYIIKIRSKALRTTYVSLVRPILLYGLPSWHPTTIENMGKLGVQRRAERIINKHVPLNTARPLPPVKALCKQIDVIFLKKALT